MKRKLKITEKSRFSNKDLRICFLGLNKKFFGGRINPKMKVAYEGSARECEGNDGISYYDPNEVFLDRDLRKFPALSLITLLHEMVHQYLHQVEGYVGYEEFGGHHTLFHAEQHRLYKAGAYEGYL